MADFNDFFPTLLVNEGGFVNDPVDPGGATNKGITMTTFHACANRYLGIAPTLANLEALTDTQAGEIYKPLYWDKLHCDEIELQALADIAFDFQVNAGDHAAKLLQKVLNDLGANPPLEVDGDIGPATLRALEQADEKEVYRRYKQGRLEYYQDLVASRPALDKFLNGWLARVNSFPEI